MRLLDCGENREQEILKNIYKFLFVRNEGNLLFVAMLKVLGNI